MAETKTTVTAAAAKSTASHQPKKSSNLFAALAVPNQRHRLAAQLLGLAETVMPHYQEGISPFVRAEIANTRESVRSVLGEVTFVKAWEDGKALTIERAIECALEVG